MRWETDWQQRVGSRKPADSGIELGCRVRVETSLVSKQDPRVPRNVAHKDLKSWL